MKLKLIVISKSNFNCNIIRHFDLSIYGAKFGHTLPWGGTPVSIHKVENILPRFFEIFWLIPI